MRIVGGQWKGRRIKSPSGSLTRPTTDRVREALFSALVSRIGSDLGAISVLDAFAGSGALGFEALSRGASSVTFVESDRRALQALRENASTLEAGERARTVAGNVFSLAKRGIAGAPFSLILLDPPYTLDPAELHGLLADLADSGSLAPGCLVSWEHAAGADPQWPGGFGEHDRKRYGTTEIDLAFYEGGSDA